MPHKESSENVGGRIGQKKDLPRSDMQASILSRLEYIQLMLKNNPQLAHRFGVVGENKDLTLPFGNAMRSVTDGQHLYIINNGCPGYLTKVDLSDFTIVTTLTVTEAPSEEWIYRLCLDGDYIYIGCETNPGKIVKINKKDMTIVDTLTLEVGENMVEALKQDDTYLYAGLYTTPAKIVRITKSDFTRKDCLTLETGENTCTEGELEGIFLYVSLYTEQLVKIRLDDFSRVSSIDLGDRCYSMVSGGQFLYIGGPYGALKIDLSIFEKVDEVIIGGKLATDGIDADGTYLYCGSHISAGITYSTITIVDLATFKEIGDFRFPPAQCIYAISIDGTYIYGTDSANPSTIHRRYLYPTTSLIQRKINKLDEQSVHEEVGEKSDLPRSDMQGTLMSRLEYIQLMLLNNPQLAHQFGVDRADKTLTLAINQCRALYTDGVYAYAGLDTTPVKIVKIDLSDFSTISTLELETGEDESWDLCLDENYIYVGTQTSPGKIVRINKSDFTRKDCLTLETGEDVVGCLWDDGTYIYAGLETSPAKIVRITKSDFTRKDVLTLAGGENICLDIISDGLYLYVSLYSGGITKVDINDFTKVSTLSITRSMRIKSDGVYLYAATIQNPSNVLKIDLSTFTIADTLTLLIGESNCESLDCDGTFLYVGSDTTPARITKVDLATFSRVGVITLASGENKCRAMCTDGVYLYMGLYSIPAKIVRRYIYPIGASLLQRTLKKLEGHSTSQLIYTRPDRAARIALTAGAGWAYGSYVEVIAANTITTPFKVIGVEVSDMVVDKEYQIGIGTGASGSEVLKQETPVKSNVATGSKRLMFDLNTVPEIPAKTRVAAKCACETDSLGCGVKLIIATKY